jgi:hypothetical protein
VQAMTTKVNELACWRKWFLGLKGETESNDQPKTCQSR